MNTLKINGAMFADIVRNGARNLKKNKEIVNELNVFPVPDGDTGDNMSMTINSIENNQEIFDPAAISQVSELIMREVLLGARGNSGVILSRIFAGIAKGLEEKIEVTIKEFDFAMNCGVKEAYNAVAKPVEGTILTVLREGVENTSKKVTEETTFETYFESLAEEMKLAVDKTPELLPTLKEAGVVDSGGVGLLYIIEGMRDALNGKNIQDFDSHNDEKTENLDISLFDENSELEFGYCTEFLLRLQNKKVNISEFSIEDFTNYLKSVGDSVVAFKDGSIVKVHVHSKKPGEILSYCQNFGEFLKVKVENMTLQHNGAIIKNTYESFKKKPHKKYAVVTVASGEGLIKTFEELGCDVVISGGQSMNPSTNDFLEAFKEIDAETIFVFPNNKNIILAAEQAAEVYKDAEIKVVKTTSIGEGYAAISMIDTNLESADEIIAGLEEVISETVTGQVSIASRDTTMDGLEISAGDYIGFSNGRIFTNGNERKEIAIDLLEKLEAKNFDIIIIAFGKDVDEAEALEVEKIVKENYNRSEVFLINGGQPVYDYILILE